jgi:hypothetical protein
VGKPGGAEPARLAAVANERAGPLALHQASGHTILGMSLAQTVEKALQTAAKLKASGGNEANKAKALIKSAYNKTS